MPPAQHAATTHALTSRVNRRALLASMALLSVSMLPGQRAVLAREGTPTPGTIEQLGVFTISNADGSMKINTADKITEASALSVDSIRAEQNLARELSPNFATFADAGLRVVLTIRNGPQLGERGKPTVFPPHTPADLAIFRKHLEAVLTQFTPSLVAVENEEASSGFVSGSVSDYLAELGAAIDVCHAHGVPVTNGGITAGVSAALTWQDLARNHSPEDADDFVRRVLAGPVVRSGMANALTTAVNGELPPGPYADGAARGQAFIDAYAELPLDYVNFHWYIDDDLALRQTVEYLRKSTGHEVVTHEIGQYTVDPAVVTGHLTTLADLHVPVVIWFDADGDPAVGLHDAPGVLRPNGDAFAAFASQHRP